MDIQRNEIKYHFDVRRKFNIIPVCLKSEYDESNHNKT